MCDINIGLHVVEVAHDIQAQVAKYIRETLGLVNSYDTWHGMVVFQQHTLLAMFIVMMYRNKECGQGDEEDH